LGHGVELSEDRRVPSFCSLEKPPYDPYNHSSEQQVPPDDEQHDEPLPKGQHANDPNETQNDEQDGKNHRDEPGTPY
jgi:hypothetical protein